MIYLDTSIVAAFYWAEALTDAVEDLLRHEAELGVSQLVEVELFSALSRRVRMREIEATEAEAIAERFQTDLAHGFLIRLALEPVHYDVARDWIRRFNTPLRTLDALHLAIAASDEMPLITADEGLVRSAELLGVEAQILRPTTDG